MTILTVDLPLPKNINKYSEEQKIVIYNYLNSLNEQQQIAYKIAYTLLETSFDIVKSNGFAEYNRELRSPMTPPLIKENIKEGIIDKEV